MYVFIARDNTPSFYFWAEHMGFTEHMGVTEKQFIF